MTRTLAYHSPSRCTKFVAWPRSLFSSFPSAAPLHTRSKRTSQVTIPPPPSGCRGRVFSLDRATAGTGQKGEQCECSICKLFIKRHEININKFEKCRPHRERCESDVCVCAALLAQRYTNTTCYNILSDSRPAALTHFSSFKLRCKHM